MEIDILCNSIAGSERFVRLVKEFLVVESALLALKSLLRFFLMIGALPDGNNVLMNSTGTDQRFPFAELNKVNESVAENNDAGESDDDSDDEDDQDSDEDDDEDDDEEGEDSDDDANANGGEGSDDEDDEGDDDSDSDEDDDDEDDDDDEEEDEEDQVRPPFKRKK